MAELDVELVRQGLDDKLPAAVQIAEQLGLNMDEICYIGDDLTDLRLMGQVGLSASVADGASDVTAAAHFVTKSDGGNGAIREVIEMILKSQKRWNEILEHYR